MSNVQDLRDDLSNGLFNLTITNFTLSVDTFFVLSATLTSYSWFQKQLKNSEGSVTVTSIFREYFLPMIS